MLKGAATSELSVVLSEFDDKALEEIVRALLNASTSIYETLIRDDGLELASSDNASGDEQIGLDIIADNLFFDNLKDCADIKYVVSEERPSFTKISDSGLSVALDPLDGSKAALVGIPSGAIFGIYRDVTSQSDFNGKNIIASGFFVFGVHLEVFFTGETGVYNARFDPVEHQWGLIDIPTSLGEHPTFAVNAANIESWPVWFKNFFLEKCSAKSSLGKPYSLRWYGSMVSEVKRLILQGGLFSYPEDSRNGYERGHLRLVYEAIPMAFLLQKIGGASSTGSRSILDEEVDEIHQKTPVHLGSASLIKELKVFKKSGFRNE